MVASRIILHQLYHTIVLHIRQTDYNIFHFDLNVNVGIFQWMMYERPRTYLYILILTLSFSILFYLSVQREIFSLSGA